MSVKAICALRRLRPQDFPLEGPMRSTLRGQALAACLSPPLNLESALAKPPNYKQEKKRREEMQKKKNEAKQREQAARKENASLPPKP